MRERREQPRSKPANEFLYDHPSVAWTDYNDHRLFAGAARTLADRESQQCLHPANNLTNPGYYVLDVRANFKLSRQLNAYLHIFNLANIRYAGIDSSSDPDALLYNPQATNSVVVGVNYGFN